MTPKVRGFVLSVSVLTWLSWAGCGSDQPLCAQIGQQAPLPGDSPLALTRDAVLLRAGDGFVLAGREENTVRWGQLSSTGDLVGEWSFDLPEQPAVTAGGQPLPPRFAVTSKAAPGDLLVVVMGVQAKSTDPYEVHAWIHDPASADQLTMQVLDVQAPAGSGLVRVEAGSSSDGTAALAAWAWGMEAEGSPIQYKTSIKYRMLGSGPDGVQVGDPKMIYGDIDPNSIQLWSCLDTTQNNAGNLAITLVEAPNLEHPQQPRWHRYAVGDDGSIGEQVLIDMKFDVSDCRIVSTPTSEGGQLLAWQNNASNGGTYFAGLTPPPPDGGSDSLDNVTIFPVLASASYGGYSQMPKVDWIAPAGHEFTIGLAGSRGPSVVRFNVFGDLRGKTLYLPSVSGNTDQASAWVGPDAVYVTYLDMPGSPTQADAGVPAGSQRYLVTVLSPADLP